MAQASESGVPKAGGTPESFVCVGCGYNLEQTDPLGQCPECGLLVSESMEKDSVRRADRAWVLGMAKGMRWLGYAYLAEIAMAVAMVCAALLVIVVLVALSLGMMMQAKSGPLTDLYWVNYPMVLMTGISYCFLIVFLWVAQRLTRREPGRELTPRPVERLRHIGRMALPMIAVLITVALPFELHSEMTHDYNAQTPAVVSPLDVLGSVVWPLIFGALTYVCTKIPEDFAGRVGSQKLHKQAKRVVIYGLVECGVGIVMEPLMLFWEQSGDPAVELIGGCALCLLLLVMVVAGVLLMVEGMLNAFGVAKAAEQQMELAK